MPLDHQEKKKKTHRRVPPGLPLGRGLRPERGHDRSGVGREGQGGSGGGGEVG